MLIHDLLDDISDGLVNNKYKKIIYDHYNTINKEDLIGSILEIHLKSDKTDTLFRYRNSNIFSNNLDTINREIYNLFCGKLNIEYIWKEFDVDNDIITYPSLFFNVEKINIENIKHVCKIFNFDFKKLNNFKNIDQISYMWNRDSRDFKIVGSLCDRIRNERIDNFIKYLSDKEVSYRYSVNLLDDLTSIEVASPRNQNTNMSEYAIDIIEDILNDKFDINLNINRVKALKNFLYFNNKKDYHTRISLLKFTFNNDKLCNIKAYISCHKDREF